MQSARAMLAPLPPCPMPFDRFTSEILDIYGAAGQPATRAKMAQVLAEFAGLCPSTADIGLHAISQWLSSPMVRSRSDMTRRSLLSSFRAACAIGAGQGYCSNPFVMWSLDRWVPEPDPEDLDRPWLARSGKEISRILQRAVCQARGGSWKARRTEALTFMAAFTGARAKEVLGALAMDIDLDKSLFHIRPNPRRKLKTKGSRRSLPLHPELRSALRSWLPVCGTWLIPQVSRRGPWFHGTIGYRPLDAVRQLGEQVAIEGLTLATFRHTFATLAEEWGWKEAQIQRWLGHTRPETQRTYRHGSIALLREAAESIRF
jgi:integrase